MEAAILLKATTNTADRMHLKRFRHPVAVEDFDGKRSTIRVTDMVRMQFENKDENPLKHSKAAMGACAYMHQPNEMNPQQLMSIVTNAGCSRALKMLKV